MALEKLKPQLGTPNDPNPMYEGMIMAFSDTIE